MRKSINIAVIVVLLGSVQVLPQSGGTFTIKQPVTSSGSSSPSGGTFGVQNTVGLPVAGVTTGGTFAVEAGFWTGMLLPTAANVTVSGRLLDSRNTPIQRAAVSLTDVHGNVFVSRAVNDGTFQIEVPAGETYVVTISHRTYRFADQVIEIQDSISGLEFRPIN